MDFWIHQVAATGLRGFLDKTPSIQTLHRMTGQPVPVLFDSEEVKAVYSDWECINTLENQPTTPSLFAPVESVEHPLPKPLLFHGLLSHAIGHIGEELPSIYVPEFNLPTPRESFALIAFNHAPSVVTSRGEFVSDLLLREIANQLPDDVLLYISGSEEFLVEHKRRFQSLSPFVHLESCPRTTVHLMRHARLVMGTPNSLVPASVELGTKTLQLGTRPNPTGHKNSFISIGDDRERFTPRWVRSSLADKDSSTSGKPTIPSPRQKRDVLVVGVIDRPASTNFHMVRGFEKQGLLVDGYNYRERAELLGGYEAMSADFMEFLADKQYQLIIYSKVNQVEPHLIPLANCHGRSWYWFMDPLQQAKDVHALQFARTSHFASGTSKEVVEYFTEVNPNSHHVIEGFNPEILTPDPSAEKKYDVVFIGNATPERMEFIQQLRKHFSVEVFGNLWPPFFQSNPPVTAEEYAHVVQRSKIALNLVRGDIFSDRVIHSMACGTLVVSQHCSDLEKFFTNRNHLAWFKDFSQCKELIEYYLNNEEERRNVAKAGCDKVHSQFTWEHICAQICSIAGIKGQPDAPYTHPAPRNTQLDKPLNNVTAFLSPHELEENILITPALKRYKEEHPDEQVVLIGLARHGRSLEQLFSGSTFIERSIAALPDLSTGEDQVIKSGVAKAEELQAKRVHLISSAQSKSCHQSLFYAEHLGVFLSCYENFETSLSLSNNAIQEAKNLLSLHRKPYLVCHFEKSTLASTKQRRELEAVLHHYQDHTCFHFGNAPSPSSVQLPIENLEVVKALVALSDRVVAERGLIFQVAAALKRPLEGMFIERSNFEEIPLNTPVHLVSSESSGSLMAPYKDYLRDLKSRFPRTAWRSVFQSQKGEETEIKTVFPVDASTEGKPSTHNSQQIEVNH